MSVERMAAIGVDKWDAGIAQVWALGRVEATLSDGALFALERGRTGSARACACKAIGRNANWGVCE